MSNSAETFAGYEIIAEIGEGPMGTVYRVRDPLMDRTVALTIISPELSADAEYVARFHSETVAVARLSHPHIVQLHTSGESEGACFFVTELIEGETLLQGIENSGSLPLTDAVAICVSMAYALEYAWKKTQLIHGDINPANIWLTSDGKARLSGLGLPKSIGGAASSTTALNPLHYVSPELAKGDAGVDFRTDIYSLGCTLFHMLAGRPPFEANDDATLLHKHIHEPPALLKAMPNCPAPLNALVNKMLAKLPGIRHGSYEELVADLMRVHGLLLQEIEKKSTGPMQVNAGQSAGPRIVPRVKTVSAPVVSATAPTEVERESRLMFYVAGGLVALILVAGALFWWVSRSQPEPPVAREQTPPPAVAKAAPSEQPADPFVREVFMLPAEEQVRRVVGVLKQLNPDFDGKETHKVENDTVTELSFSTVAVTDISPLRALTALRKLQCSGEGGMGLLADLSPLHGLRLQELKCYSNAVSDITPLKGMPLTYLGLRDTKVSDLAALQGMPLTHLEIRSTPVSDLLPLKGMKIEALLMSSTAVADLVPLQDMPLRSLFLGSTKVQDLSPLKGMSLSILHCSKTPVSDLAVLKGMPLKELVCDFKPERDVAVLRSIKTLERINFTPAVEFWIKVGAQLATAPTTNAASAAGAATPVNDAFIAGVAALPAEEQVQRVVAKLKELNPQFKGQETHKVENGKVTELTLVTVAVTNISPLRALPALQCLRLNGTTARGVLADLSCLKPAAFPALKRLWCHFTEVSDLSPLAGLPLEELYCDRTKVTSLAPLRTMPLKELRCNFQPERDKEVLWAIKSLQTINDQPAAEFWKSVGPPEDPFFKQVAALPAAQLVPAVMAKLKELNPNFDGKQTNKIEGGAVAELAISTAGVTNITPLKALKQLRRLSLTPWTAAQRGSLADLSPLQGLSLTVLRCQNNPISDLSPLKGMPLTTLICGNTQVTDLAALTDMRLMVLWCNNTAVKDLGPLEGMPLTMLACNSAPIADFAPLQRLPLQELHYDPKPEHNAVVLGIKSLKKINNLPAAMFKMRAEMTAKGGSTPAQRPATTPGRATTPASAPAASAET
ncbi:MAG: protein kinase, partial [Verrucomicrobia bacterium]|nr:protein kinase [Verrucomicrobiota bacterium]